MTLYMQKVPPDFLKCWQ